MKLPCLFLPLLGFLDQSEAFAPIIPLSRNAAPTSPLHSIEPRTSDDLIVQDTKKIVANSKNEKVPLDLIPPQEKKPQIINGALSKRKMELAWCNHDSCHEAIREKVVGEHNHMELTGPATGQVVYSWEKYSKESGSSGTTTAVVQVKSPPAVLMLVKRDEEELLLVAVEAIKELTSIGVQVLVDSTLRGDLEKHGDIDLDSELIRLFYPKPLPGFGSGDQLVDSLNDSDTDDEGVEQECPADTSDADLVVTLGGDGLLMYAAHIFSGPVPPILPVAGGSMGFLTPFAREEMLEAILISLGLREVADDDEDDLVNNDSSGTDGLKISQRANNNMQIEATDREGYNEKPPLAFGNNAQICISMRMRLDCRIFGSDGTLRCRYPVLNEVVIDRGSSPYLASLECFCDDVHLTTVQADGIIFSTPTGSTAYSMAAGGSVVHPAVPAILVTPICPHVLSFRSMVFPDHVVLRCYVPSDARSTACVYFDGKHRTELHRGDSVQIQMSAHPVPTINRADHSADWLSSLKRNFNFNTRVRQSPL
eukprot:CAMPEP_0172320550 /NCGR_PEP_ID=MMETSP1058-20130122/40772_1 /TAXON_ID=83371 /ORGANISM="Detonula confervacea, Strain CCMP 353" /LENGTH=536 /DNA_ID=CAMNT_0013035839 /DNA_START=119 /DNA_END=1726 /DNA_ORIENTATION=+